jgi:hypothetical protein
MRWHIRLGHLPFANIRLMAARKEIPSWLTNCRIPKCQSCLYGKATKRPWRTKGQSGTLKEVTLPGQCVSVDQLESPVAGFIGQNKGFFFRKRYKVATIFVDHFSRLSYVYLQESTKGCKLWLPSDRLKPIPFPMESRSNNTMPAMGDLLSTYSSITVRNWVRRYPYVESVHTSKMALLKGGSRISLKGPERPFYTPFTGGPQQSQSTCGHMHFATSMRYTTPLLLLRRVNHHWRLSHRLP